MKGEIKLEIFAEDIADEVKSLVREICGKEIVTIMKEQATALVKEEVNKMIGPMLTKFFNDGEEFRVVGSDRWSTEMKKSADERIRAQIIEYINEPTYKYSKDGRNAAELFMKSSTYSEPSRLQRMIDWCIVQYVNKELLDKINERVEKIANESSKIEDAVNSKIAEIVTKALKK